MPLSLPKTRITPMLNMVAHSTANSKIPNKQSDFSPHVISRASQNRENHSNIDCRISQFVVMLCRIHSHDFKSSANQTTMKKLSSNTAAITPSKSFSSLFLSRLVEMLSQNEGVISFVPGSTKKGSLGKIVVHDRIKVELDVLPKYFNHSSFASLRRQLNYFSFARQGKGRQKCATYSNDQVVEMEDILRLRRRPAPTATTGAPTTDKQPSADSISDADGNGLLTRLSSSSSSSSSCVSKKRSRHHQESSLLSPSTSNKKSRFALITPPTAMSKAVISPNLVSPRSSPSHSATTSPNDGGNMRITLDLTAPPLPPDIGVCGVNLIRNESVDSCCNDSQTSEYDHRHQHDDMDADVLAACQALVILKSTGRDSIVPF
jgi:hypothetical protein